METFTTPNGKVIEVFHSGFNLRVKFKSGGKLPPELDGSWTSFTAAKSSIEKYLETLNLKESKTLKDAK